MISIINYKELSQGESGWKYTIKNTVWKDMVTLALQNKIEIKYEWIFYGIDMEYLTSGVPFLTWFNFNPSMDK